MPLSAYEMARVLRLDPECVRAWARKGIITGHKEGKQWMFHEQDFPFSFEYPLLLSKDIASYLSVHVRTVTVWARDGVLPCVRFSNNVLRFVPGTFDVGQLKAYKRHQGRKGRKKHGSYNAADPIA